MFYTSLTVPLALYNIHTKIPPLRSTGVRYRLTESFSRALEHAFLAADPWF